MQITKRSHQREKIIEVLRKTKCHPTATYIYEKVREDIPNISLGTVYRNLARLSESGDILRLDFGTGTEHFDGDISSHYHIMCEKCGKVLDVYEHEENLNDIAKKYFCGVIKRHSLVFFGECENCSK